MILKKIHHALTGILLVDALSLDWVGEHDTSVPAGEGLAGALCSVYPIELLLLSQL